MTQLGLHVRGTNKHEPGTVSNPGGSMQVGLSGLLICNTPGGNDTTGNQYQKT